MTRGDDFCNELRNLFAAKTDTDLADAIGLTQGRVSQIRQVSKSQAKAAAKLVHRVTTTQTKKAFSEAIKPVVEFFPVDRY